MTAPATQTHEDDILGKAYDSKLMRRLLVYTRPYRALMYGAFALLCVEGGVQVVGPLLTRRVIDVAVPARDMHIVATCTAFLLLALVAEFVTSYGQTWLTSLLGQRVMRDLRMEIFEHLQRLSVSFFDRTPAGRLITRVTLRTITMNIPSQKIITKDNVSIDIAAVAYYHIVDPTKSVIAIENVNAAINQISQTTVRNVVGQFSLDQLLSQTLDINAKIKDVIDGHTEPWGAQVTAVEIKDITLPDNMQRAMAKEAEAERERRAKIVAAEGEFQAAVKLGEAADIISQHPVALQLRTLQTMAEISIEKNSTIIFPAQFMTTVQEAIKMIRGEGAA